MVRRGGRPDFHVHEIEKILRTLTIYGQYVHLDSTAKKYAVTALPKALLAGLTRSL